MRGRKPLPSQLKVVTGNRGRRPINEKEPKPTKGIPDCPSFLTPTAKVAYREISEDLNRMGILTLADKKALELLCDAYSEWRKARDFVRKHGMTYESKTVTGEDADGNTVTSILWRRRPEVDIASNAWKRIKSMLVEFGLTASSRTRLEVEGDDINADQSESYFG